MVIPLYLRWSLFIVLISYGCALFRDFGPEGQYVVLTFNSVRQDETASILAILQSKRVPATFFVQCCDGNDESRIRSIHSHGHDMGLLGNENNSEAELTKSVQFISKIIGEKLKNYRPDFKFNDSTLALIKSYKMRVILSSVDSGDSEVDLSKTVIRKVIQGSIVKLSTSVSVAKELPNVIDGLIERGYEFISVSQAFSFRS